MSNNTSTNKMILPPDQYRDYWHAPLHATYYGGYAAALLRAPVEGAKMPDASIGEYQSRLWDSCIPPPPPRSSLKDPSVVQHHHYYHHPQMCANCGGHGHMYRVCTHPVSSFGIICFRRVKEKIEYLMVQRKDSLSFVEFVRGKYNIQNRGYVMKLLSGMTNEERSRLSSCAFDELWHGFWQSGHTRTFMKEYEQSKARFTMLRSGYYLKPASVSEHGDEFFSLAVALNASTSIYADTEFGFPKGRRNINETDLQCGLREFSEETGIVVSDIQLLSEIPPCEEVFRGSNWVRYRHVYYVAELKPESKAWDDVGVIPVVDPVQLREVKSVGWFDAEGVMERLRVENQERRDMFLGVNERILQLT